MSGQSAERLMDIILQMKINLVHINETLSQQNFEIRQQVAGVFEGESKSLERCLMSIDDKLKACVVFVDDYQRLHATLSNMREKLIQLGAEPAALPGALLGDGVEEVIAWRMRELRAQEKL
ncbi:MAG: hypothetical protein EXR70_19055 [Deltaproteobacteria bacterium]|nr:hypothetical protein [Deltaproteobacteria bacterium]